MSHRPGQQKNQPAQSPDKWWVRAVRNQNPPDTDAELLAKSNALEAGVSALIAAEGAAATVRVLHKTPRGSLLVECNDAFARKIEQSVPGVDHVEAMKLRYPTGPMGGPTT